VEELLQFIESKQPLKGKKKPSTKEPITNDSSGAKQTKQPSKQLLANSTPKNVASGDQQSNKEEPSTGRQQLRNSSGSVSSTSSSNVSVPSSLQSSSEIPHNTNLRLSDNKSILDPMSDEFWEYQLQQSDDDGLDAETRAALDKEVEEFRQRLDAVNQHVRL